MIENENAALRGQPKCGEEQKRTLTSSYHTFQRSATTAAEDSRPRASSAAAPGEESVCVVTDLRRFSHAAEGGATTLLEQARAAITRCVHEGIELGREAEALSRCEALLDEIQRTMRALELTLETRESELL